MTLMVNVIDKLQLQNVICNQWLHLQLSLYVFFSLWYTPGEA